MINGLFTTIQNCIKYKNSEIIFSPNYHEYGDEYAYNKKFKCTSQNKKLRFRIKSSFSKSSVIENY